jgi:phosphatidylinositol glycan class Z
MYELMMHSPTTNITDTTAAQPQRILLVQQQQQQEQTGHTQRYPHRSLLPWEWQPGHANRAVTPPLITVGLAIGPLMSLLDMCGYASSSAVLLVLERAVIASMTLLVDIAVYKGAISLFSGTDTDANAKNDSRREEEREQYGCMALLCLGSSWPALVMFSHPFSNTTETIVSSTVFLLFVTKILPLLRIHPQQQQQGQGSVIKAHNSQPLFPRLHYAILLGALLSVGVWTRFTFPVFALGPALAVLCVVVMVAEQQRWKSPSRETGAASTRALLDGVKWLIGVAIGALTTCAALILIDTIYYTGEFDWRNIVVTPLNNLLYNSNPANLALHGIHPRWTHALVNIPLMFGGPVPMLLAWHLAQVSARWFWSFWCRSHQKQPSRTAVSRQHQMQTIILYTTLLSMIAIPLLALSLAPHQEPRFLLPTILPLSILLASWMYKLRATNSMKSYRTVVRLI